MYKRMKILLYTILCICLVFYNGITIEAKESKKGTKQVKVIKKSSKKEKAVKKKPSKQDKVAKKAPSKKEKIAKKTSAKKEKVAKKAPEKKEKIAKKIPAKKEKVAKKKPSKQEKVAKKKSSKQEKVAKKAPAKKEKVAKKVPTKKEKVAKTTLAKKDEISKENKKNEKKQKTVFKITPKSKNYDDRLTVFKGDEYGLVRSYVDELKKRGGGTLILRKGTYRISKPIYISSNITIILGDGVVVKKTFDERVGARSIFQFVDRNKIEQMQSIMGDGSLETQIKRIKKKNEKLLYKKYNGVKNSALIGKGNATIDLRGEQDALAVVIGHCRNLKVQGITFKNSNSNHFIELDATDTITIRDCTFQNAKKSEGLNKEAINLDTPDLTTKGFNCFWSSQDKTPNKNVIIKNCHFSNLERGIGTHQFSANQYHTNIKITQCTFDNVSVPIFGLNWRNVQIANNDMQTIRKIGSMYDGNSIFLAGVKEVTIRDNIIQDFQQPYIKECYNVSQHYYPAIYSNVTDREIRMIAERNDYYD